MIILFDNFLDNLGFYIAASEYIEVGPDIALDTYNFVELAVCIAEVDIVDMQLAFVVDRFVDAVEAEIDTAVVEFVVVEFVAVDVAGIEPLFNGFEPNLLDLNYLLFDIVEIFAIAYKFVAWHFVVDSVLLITLIVF